VAAFNWNPARHQLESVAALRWNAQLRGLETLLKLPEVILSDLETPRQPAAQARIAARSGFTPTMFITRVRL
jgi:hypothetical protein